MKRRYRGSRKRIGFLIPLLVILCVIAAGVLYFVNDNVAFTNDGIILSLPGRGEEQPKDDVNTNLIIEENTPPGSSGGEDDAPPAEEAPEPSAPEADMIPYAVFAPRATVVDAAEFDEFLDGIPESGINTVVLEVKSDDGFLAFSETSQLAVAAGVSADSNDALISAMEKSRSRGFRVALFASCFKDNEAARKSQTYAARTANRVIWLDNNNTRWLSAYSETARAYIADIVKTLAELLPDEIILSNISLPATGRTELLYYGEGDATARSQISSFIEEITAAAPEGVELSAVYENYKGASLTESGQSLEDFSGSFDRLYIADEAGRYTLALTQEMREELAAVGQSVCTIVERGAEDEAERVAAAGGSYMLRPAEDKLLPPPA